MEKLGFILSWIRDILWTSNIYRYKIEIINDNPDENDINNNIIYVVKNGELAKWAYLKCPCGCDDSIMLSLNRDTFPSWRIKQDKFGRATISPSVNKLDGCQSHFFIKKGKVVWVHAN